jgi:hypothetical protein
VIQKQTYTSVQRLGHLVSWLVLLAVPVYALLSIAGWLSQPFGDLGPLSDVFLIVLAAVFVHGIVQVASEPAG